MRKRSSIPLKSESSRLELCNRSDGQECLYEEDYLHELFISFGFTNRLRKIIPNFQLCYGGIKACKPEGPKENVPYLGISEQCACDSSQTIDYLILEKLNGVTMSEALKNICTLDQAVNWLSQIILALELGVINFGLTHYNLHTDNIEIIPVDVQPDKTLKVKYWHRNQILLLKVSSIAVLKGFETAHVKHMQTEFPDDGEMVVNRSEHFGVFGSEGLGVYSNETRPFYDVYKLYTPWMLKITKDHNKVVFEELKKASKFFGFKYERDLNRVLKEEAKLGFAYSSTIETGEKIRSLGEFFSFLIQIFPPGETLSTLSSYSESLSLHCVDYCPLKGHLEGSDHDYLEHPLRFLGSEKRCMERQRGLEKRVKELERIGKIVCPVSVGEKKAEKERA